MQGEKSGLDMQAALHHATHPTTANARAMGARFAWASAVDATASRAAERSATGFRMGDAKKRSRSQKEILASAERCIYCEQPATSIEHMPPVAMFRDRARPSGLEFPSCQACNNGTSTADLVASFMAHITPFDGPDDWRTQAVQRFLGNLRRKAPGLTNELMRPEKSQRKWLWSPGGLLRESHQINADGPILKQQMDIFSAKLAMALFYEHMAKPLPLDGLVFTTWFLNAGLNQKSADALLSIMPIRGELKQGSKSVGEQFGYRYNSDDKEIFAALAGFHGNLHVLVIATSNVERYGSLAEQPHTVVRKPGTFL